jgi:diguanylate cyclase
LKIDRSFVKDLHRSEDDAAICAAIIAMARELKLKVIAEGVENAEQLKFLRRHRCDQAQGYLISRPIPMAELRILLQKTPLVEGMSVDFAYSAKTAGR